MDAAIQWLEAVFRAIPLPVLEVWGRFGAIVGTLLMVCAFGGLTFRPAGHWGLGRELQSWDVKALLGIVITFLVIILSGYLGSFIVLVPGAQTFESLKDLAVFVCILIFGYPALLAVPFAYGVSDLIEGVPPGFLLDWLPGYFINPACFWVAHQLIGKDPDFRKLKTWGWYAVFVLVFMSIEPQLWGYLCADKFTSELSYRNITPALFFTTSITWLLAPFAMLVVLPVARKIGVFWAESPGSVRHRLIGHDEWLWESGPGEGASAPRRGLPIRAFLVAPFIVLILTMVGATASVTSSSSERAANQLAGRLHVEIAQNIAHQLDGALQKNPELATLELDLLLGQLLIASHGRALITDATGVVLGSTTHDEVTRRAVENLGASPGSLRETKSYRFDILTAKPLTRETWLAQATPYAARPGWVVITAVPESYFLGGVRAGNSRSAMLFAVALVLSLIAAMLLAAMVTSPMIRIAETTRKLAAGDLSQRLPSSPLEELQTLSTSFNEMASQLQTSFDRLQLATRAADLGIWDWDIVNDTLVWDETMCRHYGITQPEFTGDLESWTKFVVPEDQPGATAALQAALGGDGGYAAEFRVRWPDGTVHYLRGVAQTLRTPEGKPLRMVGVNSDITAPKLAELELLRHRNHLEALVAERTTELQSRTSQLEMSNKELEAFSYSVSHDLRAPLRGIDGWSLALLEDYGHLLDEKASGYLQRVRSETQRMGELIDDLLKLSQITRSEMKFQEVDLTHLAGVVVRRLEEGSPARKVAFTLEPGLIVQGDAHFLEVALTNLLGNAFKFTGKIPEAKIGFGRTCRDGVQVYFVKDNGAGFDMAWARKLFGAFQRMHKQTEFPGNGVGLAMVKRIVNLHQGKVWAESEEGRGATFFFTLGDVPC